MQSIICVLRCRRKKRAFMKNYAVIIFHAIWMCNYIIEMHHCRIFNDIGVSGGIWSDALAVIRSISNLFPHMKEAWLWFDDIWFHVLFFFVLQPTRSCYRSAPLRGSVHYRQRLRTREQRWSVAFLKSHSELVTLWYRHRFEMPGPCHTARRAKSSK